MHIIQKIESEQSRRELNFRPGDNVCVHVKIKEGDKERIQIFEGVVIAIRKNGIGSAFTVRKISYGVGVERTFPVQAPSIDKVEVMSSGRVRRAKLFFLRGRRGKAARLKDRDTSYSKAATAKHSAAAGQQTPPSA